MEGLRHFHCILLLGVFLHYGHDVACAGDTQQQKADMNLMILQELRNLGGRMTDMENYVMGGQHQKPVRYAKPQAGVSSVEEQDCPFIPTEQMYTGSGSGSQTSGQTCTDCDVKFQSVYSDTTNEEPTWIRAYPTVGQGVMSFNTIRNNPFSIVVKQLNSSDYISLDVQQGLAFFTLFLGGKQYTLASVSSSKAGFDADLMVSYWFSYDRDRLVLKYGKGYVMEETTIMTYDFLKCPQPADDVREATKTLFNAAYMRMIFMYDRVPNDMQRSYQNVIRSFRARGEAADKMALLGMQKKVSFDKNPLVTNRPPVIMDSENINLFALDRGGVTFSQSLPDAARELYENVKPTELNFPVEVSDYLLSDAIRYSINNPGCALYERLKAKQDEFSGPNETYLRVTLGSSYGDSPGIPYVLEIWPSGHNSPVHNHGNANAVIKVLFGTINIKIYNKFTPDADGKVSAQPVPMFNFNAFAGNFTWLDRNWYQTHMLENISDDFCATVQCYKYPDTNNVHWPDFDYVSDENQIAEFIPDSDFQFIEMRDIVLHEIQDGCPVTQ